MHPLVKDKLPQIAELCRRYHVRRLDLFGSAVGVNFDPSRSDLDFAVEYLPDPETRTLDAYFGFKEKLERLFGRQVDLVAVSAVRNRYFREELDETKVPVYAAYGDGTGHAPAGWKIPWKIPRSPTMRRSALKLLEDIRLCADAILRFTVGKSESDYLADEFLRSAVERQFEIIGEAMSNLRDRRPDVAARVTEADPIVGFRNVLIHGYHIVEHDRVWNIVVHKVPLLLREVQSLIAEEEASP